jgi:YD repeat-containing protein
MRQDPIALGIARSHKRPLARRGGRRLVRWFLVALSLGNCGIVIAAEEDCVANGGKAICTPAVPAPLTPTSPVDADMWTYGVCDDTAAFVWRERIWCEVAGGTWVAQPGGPVCNGAQAAFEPVIVPWAQSFESNAHSACQISNTDSGWGMTVNSYNCWSGGPSTFSGILVRDLRQMDFQGKTPDAHGACTIAWSERVVAAKWRTATCPEGYNMRHKTDGSLECWHLPACCSVAGNPINSIRGNKVEQWVDYRAGTAGGLEFARYYDSHGYFQRNGSARRTTDYWRTNWDRRIIVDGTSAGILAYAQRPDGSVKVFLPSGAEAHNTEGSAASDVLAKLVDGSGATIGWRLTTATRDVESYDAAGRLLSATARTGFAFTLGYDGGGRLTNVTDSFGRRLVLAYDSNGRLSTMTDPAGLLYQYAYDSTGRLATVTYPDNAVRTHVYEDSRFLQALTGVIDESGVLYSSWAYDSSARAISSQHAGGVDLTKLAYSVNSATSGSTTVTDPLGAARTYSYSSVAGVLRMTQVTQPCPTCSPMQYTYDANGNVASRTDFNGKKVCFSYDLSRNLEASRLEGALSGETCSTVLVSPPNRPDVRLVTTTWNSTYRLPATITEPAPGGTKTTTFTYDAVGNLTQKSIVAPANNGTGSTTARTWTWTYGTYGRVLIATDPDSQTTTTTYYAESDPDLGKRGNVAAITNAAGHVTQITSYDASGRPLSITDPNGLVTSLNYHPRGWITSRRVGSELTSYTYDGVGQLTRVTLPDGSSLQYIYDAAHRLGQINDGLGNKVVYTLDAMGNRVKETAYDPSNTLARSRQQVYDNLNRLHQSVGAQ